MRELLGNRIRFKKEIIKDYIFVHTPRQATPRQEHLGLFVDCFCVYLLIINFTFQY